MRPIMPTGLKRFITLTRNHAISRVDAEQLKIGMDVIELDRPWIESPFSQHGFRISNYEQLKQLQNYCQYAYVSNNTPSTSRSEIQPRQNYINSQSFKEALPAAKQAHRQAKHVVTGLLKNLRLGQDFETSLAKKAVKQCVDSVIANEEAVLWLGLLKNVDEYTARHSMNVGLLSIILGRAEGLPPEELETIGLCGMLHDMGKSKIPLDILNKEGAFSHDEFEIMKTHTTLGHDILTKKADLTAEIANVAYSHHERLSGRGYPRALQAEDISYYTRIVAIADAYDAITSKRVYSPSKTSLEGLKILIGAKGTHFDPDLVDRFVECIGVYPAGSIAELNSGEVGIILPTPVELRKSPKVLIVRDHNKQPCQEKIIDLSREANTQSGKVIKIRHLLSDDAFGIQLADYHDTASLLAAD